LDLEVFISSNAFYDPALFDKQLELTRFVFALITNIKSRGEVDTTGAKPIMLYNTLLRSRCMTFHRTGDYFA
jgi:hypothetical protein